MEYEELKRITQDVLELPYKEIDEETPAHPTISSGNPTDRVKNG
jgi:hypothetical protein